MRAKKQKPIPSPHVFHAELSAAVDTLESLDYLRQKKGKYSGRRPFSTRTTIQAGARLRRTRKKHQLTFEDLAVSDAEEVLILKRAKGNLWTR